MTDYRLGAVEARFADIVWESAPISTADLVKICAEKLSWKRTTTYTVLKRLGEKGLFQMQNGTVTVLIARDDYYAAQSAEYVEESFGGSLPAFLAAFTKRKGLSQKEIDEIKTMIDACRKE